MTKLFVEKSKVEEAVIQAAREGGDQTVYITDKAEVFCSTASQDSLEAGGMNIVETIEVRSARDLGYEDPETFVEEDADYCYLDDLESDAITFDEEEEGE